jgi:hypothetical protein
LTGRPNKQPLSCNQYTVERPLHIGILSRAFPVEDAALLDNHVRAVSQLCLDLTFHDQPIAGGDLTLYRYARADDQGPHIGFALRRSRFPSGRVGH